MKEWPLSLQREPSWAWARLGAGGGVGAEMVSGSEGSGISGPGPFGSGMWGVSRMMRKADVFFVSLRSLSP